MESIASHSFSEASTASLLTPANGASQAVSAALPRAALLQRASAPVEMPDRSYWTAYDHFMIEREAREMRRAHMHAMIGKGWAAVRKRLLG
jgi:hypothetical protein